MLVQDIYLCLRALIREELTLSGEALPPAPASSQGSYEDYAGSGPRFREKRKFEGARAGHTAARLADFPIVYNLGGESDEQSGSPARRRSASPRSARCTG